MCNYDCLNCTFKDCVNISNTLSREEREFSNALDSKNRQYRSNKTHTRHKYYLNHKLLHPNSEKEVKARYYKKHKLKIREKQKGYYAKNRESILNQKKTYYQEHREEILSKYRQSYIPRPRKLKDTLEAEKRRIAGREYYARNKKDILRKKKERYKERKEQLKK